MLESCLSVEMVLVREPRLEVCCTWWIFRPEVTGAAPGGACAAPKRASPAILHARFGTWLATRYDG
ncbi:hypothetical protein ACFPRL_14515 [Pseudoclavibacter helvolus]